MIGGITDTLCLRVLEYLSGFPLGRLSCVSARWRKLITDHGEAAWRPALSALFGFTDAALVQWDGARRRAVFRECAITHEPFEFDVWLWQRVTRPRSCHRVTCNLEFSNLWSDRIVVVALEFATGAKAGAGPVPALAQPWSGLDDTGQDRSRLSVPGPLMARLYSPAQECGSGDVVVLSYQTDTVLGLLVLLQPGAFIAVGEHVMLLGASPTALARVVVGCDFTCAGNTPAALPSFLPPPRMESFDRLACSTANLPTTTFTSSVERNFWSGFFGGRDGFDGCDTLGTPSSLGFGFTRWDREAKAEAAGDGTLITAAVPPPVEIPHAPDDCDIFFAGTSFTLEMCVLQVQLKSVGG
jgi:hypothetical protein